MKCWRHFSAATGALLWLSMLVGGCGARSSLDVPLEREEPVEGCVDRTVSVEVPSTAPWTDTGVDVTAGQRLQIRATGKVRYGVNDEQITDANGGHHTGKKFFPAAVLPKTMVVSLIGKIGGTTSIDTGELVPEGIPTNGAGFVGVSYDEIVVDNGRLFLGFNDQKKAFGDNSGSFAVSITLLCE